MTNILVINDLIFWPTLLVNNFWKKIYKTNIDFIVHCCCCFILLFIGDVSYHLEVANSSKISFPSVYCFLLFRANFFLLSPLISAHFSPFICLLYLYVNCCIYCIGFRRYLFLHRLYQSIWDKGFCFEYKYFFPFNLVFK